MPMRPFLLASHPGRASSAALASGIGLASSIALATSIALASDVGLAVAATTTDPVSACAAMADVRLAAAAIGLPTRGARVTAATRLASSTATPGETGGTVVARAETAPPEAGRGYCQVSFAIDPVVDAKAPVIEGALALPDAWNGKGLMFGGGGYNGTIPDLAANVPAALPGSATPLARGYATFGSDSGHRGTGGRADLDGSFGSSDEALRNYAGDALEKTRAVAVALLQRHYGRAPTRLYFAGGSTGGREALAVVQRWPVHWDGAIAFYPAWNAASLNLQFGRITRALALPGAYPSPAKRRLLYEAVLQVCDGLDGVNDGLIANVRACNARFDPDSAQTAGRRLRCPRGSDAGDHCLSDAQIGALKTMASGYTFPYPLASGETQYPGFNVWGADLGRSTATPAAAAVTAMSLGSAAPAPSMPANAPYGSVFWDQWVRFVVTRDPAADAVDFEPAAREWRQRIAELGALQDVNRTDLTAFHTRGGKLLLAHGLADVLVSPRATAQYYERLQTTMGVTAVHDFVRYYEIAGYAHVVSTVFNAGWDSLAALEAWVEQAQPPERLVVSDSLGVPGRTRPLCPFPTWPRYRGAGDIDRAESFECVATLD